MMGFETAFSVVCCCLSFFGALATWWIAGPVTRRRRKRLMPLMSAALEAQTAAGRVNGLDPEDLERVVVAFYAPMKLPETVGAA